MLQERRRAWLELVGRQDCCRGLAGEWKMVSRRCCLGWKTLRQGGVEGGIETAEGKCGI